MIESVYVPLVFLAAGIGLSTAVFATLYRDRPGAKPLAVFAVAASLWAVFETLVIAQSGLETMSRFRIAALAVSAVLPPSWLLFAFEYTGSKRGRVRTLAVFLVEPLLFWGLLATNDRHELVWSSTDSIRYGAFETQSVEFGLAFWGHQTYSYLLLAAGAAVLFRMLTRTNRLYRWQGTALLGAISVPVLTNAAYSFGLLPPGIDPSGIGYVLAAVVLAVTVLETELAGVAPATRELGREAVLAELDDAILILDDEERLVDANPAGERLLGEAVEDCLGRELAAIDESLSRALGGIDRRAEIELEDGQRKRYYDARVSSLYRGYGMISGRVVSLRDVTGRRQREQRLDVLNRLLRHNVRNELNLVRGKIDLASTGVDGEEVLDHLEEATAAVDGIVERSNKLGRLSRLLDAEQRDSIDLASEIRESREEIVPSDGSLRIDLPEELFVAGGSSLVAAFEELVENAIEHNDSDQPRVTVRLEDRTDRLAIVTVSDNGPGIEKQEIATIESGEETALQHSSGVGLWLVNWVVERAGGSVSFENDDGCTVRVRLPRAGGS